jgi:hypothetical protein
MREAIDRSIVVFDQPDGSVMAGDPPGGVQRIGHGMCKRGATCPVVGSLAWARGAMLKSSSIWRAVVVLSSSRRSDPNDDAILARG